MMSLGLTTAGVAREHHHVHVIVLAPFGRDAAVIEHTLGNAGVPTTNVDDIGGVIAGVRACAGAVIVTEEALTSAALNALFAALADQPSWSDLPVILLLAKDGIPAAATRHLTPLKSAHSVTVLQRPTPAITLVSAVQSALRARQRQYEVRDLIAKERAAREDAEAATRVKDEFLATVSHELRTPLSAVLIWAQLLEAGRLRDDQIGDAIHAIVSGATAQSRLIEDLLDMSRMLTGTLRLDVQPRPLAPIVLAAAEVVRPMADAKHVRLELQLEPGAELVLIDAERAQQIFWNLLCNAVKFTPADGVVAVRYSRQADHACVEVTDTGEGISLELLPHVFERSRQAAPARTRRSGGLGLGLAIVHQLVELHGGTVTAHSAGKDRGSTFAVRLPVIAAMINPW